MERDRVDGVDVVDVVDVVNGVRWVGWVEVGKKGLLLLLLGRALLFRVLLT